MIKKLILFSAACFLYLASRGQCTLVADAGTDKMLAPSGTVALGGSPTASSGTPPYTYAWSPSTGLSSSAVANPTVSGLSSTVVYTLTVTDNASCTSTAVVWVYFTTPAFAELKKSLDAGYYQIDNTANILYFQYTGEYNSGALTYNIYDKDNNSISTAGVPLTKQQGDNRFSVNLGTLSISTTGYYVLEVINEKKERFLLRFKK